MATRIPFPQLEPALHLVNPIPFSARTESLTARVSLLSATNLADLPAASDLLEAVLSLKSSILSYHAEAKSWAYEAHQAACRAEHVDLDPVLSIEKALKGVIGALETLRQRLQEEAERAARRAAEQSAAELHEQLIEAAERSGAPGEAIASLCAMPLSVPIAIPAPMMERPKGIFTTDQFDVAVTDLKALAQAMLDGKAPEEVLQPNLKVLTAMAKALKGNLQLPGVSITRDLSVSGRKRR